MGQVAYAASIQDSTHEGKSIVDLSEEKKVYSTHIRKNDLRQDQSNLLQKQG